MSAALATVGNGERPSPAWKWVGGKRWLVQKHAHLLPDPKTVKALVLPFCGGGAVAYHYAGATARLVLSDTNPHLIDTYRAMRDMPEELIAELREIRGGGYTRDRYEHMVARLNNEPTAPLIQRAAWFFVVTQWGYNGLWRTNQQGKINVAFGKPSKAGAVPALCDPENLRACSRALERAEFACVDFEPAARIAGPGDFVYLDPPFVPASKTASFVGYGAAGFSSGSTADQGALFASEAGEPTDQQRLAGLLPHLDHAGARWALSNSDTPEARALYTRPGWTILRLERSGTVSSDPNDRGAVGEILVRNFT